MKQTKLNKQQNIQPCLEFEDIFSIPRLKVQPLQKFIYKSFGRIPRNKVNIFIFSVVLALRIHYQKQIIKIDAFMQQTESLDLILLWSLAHYDFFCCAFLELPLTAKFCHIGNSNIHHAGCALPQCGDRRYILTWNCNHIPCTPTY